jgi:exopolysaccharide production protein ExoF
MLCALLGSGPVLAADDFVVGPGDKLSITVHRRTDLSGEFRVLPGGALSLPFLGNLPVAGKSVEQVRDAVAQRLREDAALLDPRVSVEIAEMQPILVAGPVRRPGQYPFQLGMTVGHALAAAGGARRLEADEVGARAEITRLRERLRHAQESYGLALVRQAQWAAVARDADDFDVPAEAGRYLSGERLQQTMASERQLLRNRNASFNSVLAMVAAQTGALNDEIKAREESLTAKEREQALLQQEAEYVDSLMQRGLMARTTRVIELRRLAVQIDGERRQISSNLARARQDIIRAEHERDIAMAQRQLECRNGIKDADDQMATLRVTVEEARSGLAQLSEALPAEEVPVSQRPASTVSILRIRATPSLRIDANADTPLLPGDLVDFSGGPASVNGHVAQGSAR